MGHRVVERSARGRSGKRRRLVVAFTSMVVGVSLVLGSETAFGAHPDNSQGGPAAGQSDDRQNAGREGSARRDSVAALDCPPEVPPPCVGPPPKTFKKKLRKGKYGVLKKVHLSKASNRHAKKKYQKAVRKYRRHHNGHNPKYATWRGFKRHLRCIGNGKGESRRTWCTGNRKAAGVHGRGWGDWFDDLFGGIESFVIRCDGWAVGGAAGGAVTGSIFGGVGAGPGAAGGALAGATSCEAKYLYEKWIG